jgi:hypothetical protein
MCLRGWQVSQTATNYRRCLRGRLTRIVKECDFHRLGDIARHEGRHVESP